MSFLFEAAFKEYAYLSGFKLIFCLAGSFLNYILILYFLFLIVFLKYEMKCFYSNKNSGFVVVSNSKFRRTSQYGDTYIPPSLSLTN
jgi:hypothetical protein